MNEQEIANLKAELDSLRAQNEILVKEVVGLEDDLVNRTLADFGDMITPETADFWRAQILENRDSALAVLGSMLANRVAQPAPVAAPATPAAVPTPADPPGRRPLHNRATARPVVPFAPGAVPTGDGNMAAKIRNRASELMKNERMPFSTAFRRAERELVGEKEG